MNNWNIDDYKKDYEPEEQWELRRAFMEKHKKEIPEDELVCLAQTMINIEFLGCRYPKEVMLRVHELSKEILGDLRNKRKNRLRRTFVGASDAANAKVKRTGLAETLKRPSGSAVECPQPVKKQILEDKEYDLKATDFSSKYGKIIIYDPSGEFEQSPISILQIIRAKCNARVVEEMTELPDGEFRMTIAVNGQLAGSVVTYSKTTLKKEAYEKALAELQKHCYTLKVKHSFLAKNNEAISKYEEECSKKASTENKIGEENLGFKLLKSLGWKGGSLGTKQDGIVNPVELSVNIGRQGLGATTNSDHYRKMLQNYKNTPTLYDLVFTNEFSSDERAVLHKLANQLGLKSKSYSKNEDRHLVISKKITIFDIARDIIDKRDSVLLEKFILLPPESQRELDR
ncbi:NF-kappa-B-repressing factor-like [Lutzomyia longipalpis]|uniref:NF-kappa-B-repressing factor-like n=1 Tax=Lutzomyia longipalpis TaxID=7200 RepID=UPI0024834149|nr:NF-kappa-B-repressing factor-like [Lutzomyia longipalpis]